MSLFPAYEEQARSASISPQLAEAKESTSDEQDKGDCWLYNSSFQSEIIPQTPIIEISSDSSSSESVEILPKESKEREYREVALDTDSSCREISPARRSKKQKKSRKRSRNLKKEEKIKYERDVENVYYEDKRRDRGNDNVDSLCSGARPRYNFSNSRSIGFVSHRSSDTKKAKQRYYVVDANEKAKKPDTVIKRVPSERERNDETNRSDCLENVEEEQKSRTRDYNEKLAESPHDTNLWLSYVEYQDRISDVFESSRTEDNNTAIRWKKLSIVEKALDRNPNSHELLRKKLHLLGELYPADEFSNKLETMVNKDTGNIILWQHLIMATQNSLAISAVSKVTNLYSKFFGTLRLWSRTSSKNHDERLLEMLCQLLVFLRQAGLWEQMWEALRLNLTLNLGLSKESLRFRGSIDEKKLIEMEEVILTSRLPLNQLWLRVESLRENCHWTSVDREQLELIGDSHRFVSPEDVTDYVHPMLTQHLNMRMAVCALITLKVPLLPTSDSILKDLALDKNSSTIDSIESLLPMLYPCIGESAGHHNRELLLRGLLKAGLTSGPQYLRYHPAQEPYLDFVRDTFRVIAESLSSRNRTSLYVWWLRFERILVYLCKNEPKSENRRKKLKGILKEFLRKAENRNNLDFYREYALIEREMDRFDSCVNILERAIQSASVTNEEDKGTLASLHRTLLETLLDSRTYDCTKKARALKVLSTLLPGCSETNDIKIVEKYLSDYLDKFLSEPPKSELQLIDGYFMPNLACELVACYVYLLYIDERDTSEILNIFDLCLKHTEESKYLRERFFENEIAVLQLVDERSRGVRDTLVQRLNNALDHYPNNFYLLSVLAGIESELPNWKLNGRRESDKPWRALSLCLAGRGKINYSLERGITDGAIAAVNKLINFHRRLSRTPETRHCPLAWRLYMLVLRENNLSEEKGEEAYHESVEQCPWARCIYIDSAEVAPQVLTQIQDVIREKDLRMHVTPEELDILRG